MIRTGTVTPGSLAPVSADCIVAESSRDKLITRIPVAPSAINLRKASANWPGAGAAVWGKIGDSEQCFQNCSAVKLLRSTNSWSPKLYVSGTIVMLYWSASACGMSHAESVRIRIVMFLSLLLGAHH